MKKSVIFGVVVLVIIVLAIAGFLFFGGGEKNSIEEGPVKLEYKGVWMPLLGISSYIPERYFPEGFLLEGFSISRFEPIFSDLDKAEEAGINTFAIQMGYWVNEQGEVSLFSGEREFFIDFIERAHARGFKIWLNSDLVYSRPVAGPSELRKMPEELIENTNLIENFKDAIVETAEFAEEFDVEIFSPSSEMYVTIGRERSKELIAEIKPRIDAVYNGKICLRGEWPKPEFSDYSCFGPTIGAPRNEEEKNQLIDNIDFQLSREDIEVELMIGELYEGSEWQGIPPEEIKRNFETVLEIVEGKVSGIFILDITIRPIPLFPESFEETIKEFYSEFG